MSVTIPSTDPQILTVSVDPQFKPWYTPNEMLRLGVYGGWFFSNTTRRYQTFKTIPPDATRGVSGTKYLTPIYDPSINYFATNGISLYGDRWFNMPTTFKRLHVGWFDWYCRYAYGTYSPADEIRMTQWRKLISVEAYYIQNGIYEGETDRWSDLTFLPQRRQRLLELAWDPSRNPITFGLPINF